MKKVLLIVLGVLVVGLGGGALFLVTKSPAQRPASTEKVESTPERLARGSYLVEHVGACTHCHSEPQPDRFGLPAKAGAKGAGGLCWDESVKFPGRLCSANITADPETGIGGWTDGEVLRALREGVNRTGEALFEIMPYGNYRHMSDEDAKSVLVYLRTLASVRRERPPRVLEAPLNIIIKFMPRPLDGPVAAPDRSDKVAHGKYLATIAGCQTCHTPVDDKHQPLPGKVLAGGQEFKFPWGGSVRSANLTPHATGLGERTRENFIALFKAFDNPQAREMPVAPAQNTVMPWLQLAGMTEEDLGAIYDYLKTIPPVENTVEKRPHPSPPGVAAKP